MADRARQKTDSELKEIEKEVRKIYRQAEKEITTEWNAYMERGQERLDRLWQAYLDAPRGERRAAKQEWQDAMRSYTLQNERYRAMVEDTANKITHANELAVAYVNNRLPDIYALNYNQNVAGEKELGISFNLVDASTVRRMTLAGDIELPYKHIDKIKDKLWNTRQLNSEVLQGILQGQSMQKIADRILHIVGNDENAAIRNARTMVTGAENRGRLDRYETLQDQGAVIHKIWLATNDGRTREWHMDMDGQEVDVNVPFQTILPDGTIDEIDYPGDPSGDPCNVYNCRCSMKSKIVGIRGSNGKIRYL